MLDAISDNLKIVNQRKNPNTSPCATLPPQQIVKEALLYFQWATSEVKKGNAVVAISSDNKVSQVGTLHFPAMPPKGVG